MEKITYNYKTESLRTTVEKALDFIGVDLSDFNLPKKNMNDLDDEAHDYRHIYRVMIGAALLAYHLGEQRNGLLAFCAAFIHDQGKRYSGEGASHAETSAREKFPLYNDLWNKYGLTDDERSIVQGAIWRHASGNPCPYRIDRNVCQIVKDADAFDRCRFFHSGARYDWRFANRPELGEGHTGKPAQPLLRTMIGETEAIWCFTKDLNFRHYIPLKDFVEYIR